MYLDSYLTIRGGGWIEKGEALFIGDYVPAPTTARVVGRISMEGGSGPKV
jgi:hypothetical protein